MLQELLEVETKRFQARVPNSRHLNPYSKSEALFSQMLSTQNWNWLWILSTCEKASRFYLGAKTLGTQIYQELGHYIILFIPVTKAQARLCFQKVLKPVWAVRKISPVQTKLLFHTFDSVSVPDHFLSSVSHRVLTHFSLLSDKTEQIYFPQLSSISCFSWALQSGWKPRNKQTLYKQWYFANSAFAFA